MARNANREGGEIFGVLKVTLHDKYSIIIFPEVQEYINTFIRSCKCTFILMYSIKISTPVAKYGI
jgi:hypothetical protein